MAVAEILFYLSRAGVMAYSGGIHAACAAFVRTAQERRRAATA